MSRSNDTFTSLCQWCNKERDVRRYDLRGAVSLDLCAPCIPLVECAYEAMLREDEETAKKKAAKEGARADAAPDGARRELRDDAGYMGRLTPPARATYPLHPN
jgi:hypothetical protein